ncbi:hypothetical protein SKAU_G00066980 [Synaphobranchus kaupii]|uniref:Torsin-1A-interacting protein 1/2 AAA+ activator domain-containing protein n=1 Tax=Synaphobranchus kaupii TaxID=118154 RepID=A0A9Q1G5Z6_SYNKA|nr:hypothetical protein SKAU_G00066980 [Synaphobranchus kaupii]
MESSGVNIATNACRHDGTSVDNPCEQEQTTGDPQNVASGPETDKCDPKKEDEMEDSEKTDDTCRHDGTSVDNPREQEQTTGDPQNVRASGAETACRRDATSVDNPREQEQTTGEPQNVRASGAETDKCKPKREDEMGDSENKDSNQQTPGLLATAGAPDHSPLDSADDNVESRRAQTEHEGDKPDTHNLQEKPDDSRPEDLSKKLVPEEEDQNNVSEKAGYNQQTPGLLSTAGAPDHSLLDSADDNVESRRAQTEHEGDKPDTHNLQEKPDDSRPEDLSKKLVPEEEDQNNVSEKAGYNQQTPGLLSTAGAPDHSPLDSADDNVESRRAQTEHEGDKPDTHNLQEKPDDSRPDDLSKHEGDKPYTQNLQEKQDDSRPEDLSKILPTIIGVLVIAVFIGVFYFNGSSAQPEPREEPSSVDIFRREFDRMKSSFPSQRAELWKRSKIHLEKHLQTAEPTEPVSMILTSGRGAERTLRCLANRMAAAFSTALGASVLHIEGADMAALESDQVKLDIDEKLRGAFEGDRRAAVIHRFEELPPGSTLIFYRYCDHENAAYKGAFLTFTVLLEEDEVKSHLSLGAVEEIVQDHIQDKFLSSVHPASFDKMDMDKFSGLWSRISHLILPVAVEEYIEEQGCRL